MYMCAYVHLMNECICGCGWWGLANRWVANDANQSVKSSLSVDDVIIAIAELKLTYVFVCVCVYVCICLSCVSSMLALVAVEQLKQLHSYLAALH